MCDAGVSRQKVVLCIFVFLEGVRQDDHLWKALSKDVCLDVYHLVSRQKSGGPNTHNAFSTPTPILVQTSSLAQHTHQCCNAEKMFYVG